VDEGGYRPPLGNSRCAGYHSFFGFGPGVFKARQWPGHKNHSQRFCHLHRWKCCYQRILRLMLAFLLKRNQLSELESIQMNWQPSNYGDRDDISKISTAHLLNLN
jgi:hypothetical protein